MEKQIDKILRRNMYGLKGDYIYIDESIHKIDITINNIREVVSYLYFMNFNDFLNKKVKFVIPSLYHTDINLSKIKTKKLNNLKFDFDVYNDFEKEDNLNDYKYKDIAVYSVSKLKKNRRIAFRVWWKIIE